MRYGNDCSDGIKYMDTRQHICRSISPIQHHRINKLLDSCEADNGKVTAVNTLDYLADYTDFHFSAEEKLQQEIGYPKGNISYTVSF